MVEPLWALCHSRLRHHAARGWVRTLPIARRGRRSIKNPLAPTEAIALAMGRMGIDIEELDI
jgi:hypothetical protein